MLERRTLLWVLAGVALISVTSCGGSDESGSDSLPTSVADSPAEATIAPAEPPATEPPATEPPTTEPPETEPSATEPPATEPPAAGLTEACLQGGWTMGVEDLAALYGALLPGFPLEANGTMAMTFSGTNVEHYINMVVTFTLPTGTISGPFDQRLAGSYTIDGDVLAITNDTIEGGWGNLQGTLGDVAVDVPVPPTELPPFSGGPATCEDDVLTVQYTSGLADVVAVFTRN